jgi:hypothetical protein
MESGQGESASPRLAEAQETLKEMLEEACAAEVHNADTGQLLRIEKVLALANEAAREVISIRKKRRRAPGRTRPGASEAEADRNAATGTNVTPPDVHRVVEDANGVRWDICAIHPSAPKGRVQLPEPYRSGWLFFDSVLQKRRLSPIPDGWESASEELLRAMCDRAETVPERAPATRPKPD